MQVDGSVASKQGVRFVFTDGSRIIYRLSVINFSSFLFQLLLFNQGLVVQMQLTFNLHIYREQVQREQLFEFTLNSMNQMSPNMMRTPKWH